MKKYLSFGGGVDSTALMLFLLDQDVGFETVFVNHGVDKNETYDYIKYLRAQGYVITEVIPDVEGFNNLYDYFWHWRIIPLIHYRICTIKFKIHPFNKYVKKPCLVYIAYDADEKKRAKRRKRKYKGIKYEFPLITQNVTRRDCRKIITDHGLKIPPKSGCYLCPFQTIKEWKKLMVEHPDLFKKAVALENNARRAKLIQSKHRDMRLESLWQENKLDPYLMVNRSLTNGEI